MRYARTMGSGFGAFLVVLAVLVRIGFYLVFRRRDGGLAHRTTALPSPDDPRWQGSRGAQVTGRACVECGEKLVIELAGKACKACGEPVHKKRCAKLHKARTHAVAAPTAPYR